MPAHDFVAIIGPEVDVKHAVILAHPNRHSCNGTLAAAYCTAARLQGDEITLRDLYGMDFQPTLQPSELPFAQNFRLREDVASERALIADSDVYALVYPLWLNSPPAILKGYLERVFGYGFAYGRDGHGTGPLLSGRKLISITTSGAPAHWVQETGALDAIRALFDNHLAGVCGFQVIDHIHFGGIVPGIRDDAVQRMTDQVAAAVRRNFGRSK